VTVPEPAWEMDDDQRAFMEFVIDQQDFAFERGPSGTWRDRWIPGVCQHEAVRCIHGDEIIGRMRRGVFRRQACLVCGRALDRDLPVLCFFTGQPHPSASPNPVLS
jgi:hypothetical protein